jgi:hypothetical protein
MNDRIKQLALQAGFKVDWQHADVQDIKMARFEKFAELIVGECVGIVEQYGTPDAFYIVDEINRVMLNIRPNKHFGVEE